MFRVNKNKIEQPVDIGRKLNVHKTFRRRQHFMYIQITSCVQKGEGGGEVGGNVPALHK